MSKKQRHILVPKNPRKANIWESESVFKTVEKATKILDNIEVLVEDTNKLPHEMAPVEVPVILLQELCENYLFLYNKLLKENLLIMGNPKSNPNIH